MSLHCTLRFFYSKLRKKRNSYIPVADANCSVVRSSAITLKGAKINVEREANKLVRLQKWSRGDSLDPIHH